MSNKPDRIETGRISIPPIFFIFNFVAGMSFSAVGSVLPDMTRLFGLSQVQVSSIPLTQFFGSFLGLLLLGFSIAKVRHILIGTAALLCMSSFALFIIPSFSAGLKVAFFCFGSASQVAVALPGIVILRQLGGESGGKAAGKSAKGLNLVYSFFSLGVTTAPLIFGAMISRGFHYPALFGMFALLSLIAGVIAAVSSPPQHPIERGLAPGSIGELFRESRLVFIMIILMNMLYASAESIPNIWIPQYFTDTFSGYPEFRSRLILSFFWGAMTVGRQLCARIIHRGAQPRHVLVFLAAMSSVFLFAAPRFQGHALSEIFFASSGFFFSAMFPIIASFSEHFPIHLRSSFFILIMSAGMIGVSGTSRLTGLIAQRFGFFYSALLGSAFLLLILSMAVIGGKRFAPDRTPSL